MQLDNEIQMLQSKIQEQEDQIKKLKSEEEKMVNYIKEFKEAIKKKKIQSNSQERKPKIDTAKYITQLGKQIQTAKTIFKNYQTQLKNAQKKSSKAKVDDLQALEKSLKEKEALSTKLKGQIKDLNAEKRRQEKQMEKKEKNEDGQKLTKIIEEVRKNKDMLDNLRSKYSIKQDGLGRKKSAIEQLQSKYIEKCVKYGSEPFTYEQFKQKKKQKRKEDLSRPKRENTSKKYQSVKDIINSHPIERIEISEKNLKDLRVKKQVAENALKNAHRKYEKQIEDLNKKVQVLRKENENLTTKLMEKKKQKQMAQSGFIQPNNKNSSTRTTRKLTPIK